MFPAIAIALGVAIAGILGFAATKPNEFRMQRTGRIKAAPEKIFPFIADFHNWPAWSPWEKLDPSMTRTLSGAASGPGAAYEWEGNSKAGKGRMDITDASAPRKVVIKMHFMKPFEAHNTAEFTLEPAGDATDVTWALYGPSPFVSKLMSVFVSMDKLIGKDFERGLANLKAAAEG